MVAENTAQTNIFAAKNASGGIGLARFSTSQPCPRSTATPTPKPNSAAPMTPNAP